MNLPSSNDFENFLSQLGTLQGWVDIVWGIPLLALISFVSLYLLYLSKGVPLKYFGLAWKLVFGKIVLKSVDGGPDVNLQDKNRFSQNAKLSDSNHSALTESDAASSSILTTSSFENSKRPYAADDDDDEIHKPLEGQISQFKALTIAVGSTVGMGNIAGVALALERGGPGAIFWMWIAGLIGMNTKFFECTLALMFRSKDAKGETQGGPMYYIPKAYKNKKVGMIMTYIFVIGGLLGTSELYQASQLSMFMATEFDISPYTVGAFVFGFVFYILWGGLTRLSNWTGALVPFMCWSYIALSVYIIACNYDKIGGVLKLIVTSAFSPDSVIGGATGYAVFHVFRQGIQRAAFSNEAGMGTAPMAHGNAKTDEPLSEGFVAMLGPFIDTVIICTLSALVLIICTPLNEFGELKQIDWISSVYQQYYGSFGKYALLLIILMFSVTTIIGMASYNEKCWMYLFGKVKVLSSRTFFIVFFCTCLFIGCVKDGDFAVGIIDIGFGIMAYVNLITIALLGPLVIKRLKKLKF